MLHLPILRKRRSSMKSAPEIAFDYRPSRRLAGAAGAVGLLAVFAVVVAGMPAWLKLIAVPAVLVAATLALQKFLACWVTHVAHGAGGWRLRDREGVEVPATLRAQSRLGRLLVLEFSAPPRSVRCVITLDVIDADTWRRLRLVLASTPIAPIAPTGATE